MSITVKLRRGTTTQHSTFTGEEAEVTVDTTKDVVVVHDGVTVGGHPMAKASDLATVAFSGDYNDLSNLPTAGTGTVTSVDLSAPLGFSVSGNPVTTSGTLALSFASGYALPTTTKQSQWDTSYGWGNHASAGYLTSYTETDPIYTASSWYTTTNNSGNWDTAYGWGNHASAGYLDSADIGVTVQSYNANTVIDAAYVHTDNNFTTTEQSKLAGIAAGAEVNVNADWSAISGDAQILNKPTAVSAFTNDAGYLTSYTETDPVYTASSWYTTTNNSANWNTAYGWGNHASAGYLTSSAIGVSVQAYDADLITWAGKAAPTGVVVGDTDTQTLSNKNIQERVVVITDATSITINADTTDLATQANTQATGTLTINSPTGTPVNGQKLMLRLQSTNVQTFSWNAIFAGSTDLPLPTASTGSSKYDYVGFIYNSTAAKWQMIAKNFGF